MLTEAQMKSLELSVAAVERQYGKGAIIRLDSKDVAPWPSIPTGVFNLDLALGIGGLPVGRIVEVFGAAGAGKTTVALSVIAEAQKQGIACLYVDVENALDPLYMKALGVDLDALYLSQPDYGEAALDIVQKMVNSQALGVIVVDSVAALVPKAEIDGDIIDQQMGLQARLMSKSLRMLNSSIAKSKTLVIFINQIREKIGVFYGPNTVTSGGRSLGFYSSMRLEVARVTDIKDKTGGVSGIRSRIKVVKNKLAPALKLAEFDILYGRGIDNIGCIVDVAESYNIITKKGSWYTDVLTGESLGQGRDNVIIYIKENEDYLNDIIKRIQENV